jgi:hypothetical protein
MSACSISGQGANARSQATPCCEFQRVVEDARAKVGHPDFVYIRKQQGKARFRVLFYHAVPFAPDIPRGFFHAGEHAVKYRLIQVFVPFRPFVLRANFTHRNSVSYSRSQGQFCTFLISQGKIYEKYALYV